jgi:Cytochrome c, mono- and diheme variants
MKTHIVGLILIAGFFGPVTPAGPKVLPAPPYSGTVPADMLLKQPVTNVFPGAIAFMPNIKNPLANDPDAVERGRIAFDRFNCSGCHAANAGGGMGPSLSNSKWIYRSDPANIFLTIYQGRPNGMPAWGTMLPDRVIWELVSYIKSISEPPTSFGMTYSKNPQNPEREQVPAGQITTATPWRFTEPFRNGQKPPG